jgi:hypothetical protein
MSAVEYCRISSKNQGIEIHTKSIISPEEQVAPILYLIIGGTKKRGQASTSGAILS